MSKKSAPSGVNYMMIIAILLVIQVILCGAILYKVNVFTSLLSGDAPSQPTIAAPSAAGPVDVSADDDAVKGDVNAPVEIIEFSDFECPFCQRFYSETLPQIEQNYIATGKVKLIYRDFPLSIHANAQKAGEASECAGEQGKFWEMHDAMFESTTGLGVASLKAMASNIGLDTAEFNTCLDSGAMAAEVRADMAAGTQAGVTGTPSFFVNGVKISGAQPYQVFQAAIEAALNE